MSFFKLLFYFQKIIKSPLFTHECVEQIAHSEIVIFCLFVCLCFTVPVFYEPAWEAAWLTLPLSGRECFFGCAQWHMHSHFIFPLPHKSRSGRITKLSFRVSDMTEFVSRGKTLKRGSGRIRFLLRRLLPLWQTRPLEGDGHTWKTPSAFFRRQNCTFCQRWLITTLFVIRFLKHVSHTCPLDPVGVAEVISFTH